MAAIVPGDIHRSVEITSFTAKTGNDGQDYQVVMKNTGNVSADVDLKVRLKDMFGNEVYSNGGQQPVIANQSMQLNYEDSFRPFFGGMYVAQADIAYDKRAGTYGVADSSQLLRSKSQEILLFVWPSTWFFVTLGALLAGALSFLVWRKHEGRVAKKQATRALKKNSGPIMWEPYQVKNGDTLEIIARKYTISLSKLAQLNKLNAPYTLRPGERIYVPQKKR